MYLKESCVTLLQVVEGNWWCDHYGSLIMNWYSTIPEILSALPTPLPLLFLMTALSQDLFISPLHMYLFISSQSAQPLTLPLPHSYSRQTGTCLGSLLISPHKYYAGFRPLPPDRIPDNPITPPTDKQLPVQPFLLLVYTPSLASIVCLGGKEIEPTR